MVNARLRILLFFFSTLMAFLDMFLTYSYHPLGVTLVVSNLAILAFVLYYLPFHRRLANVIAATVASASTATALVAYGSTATSPTSSNALIAGIVLLFPACFGGFALVWFRTSKLYGLKLSPTEPREDLEKPYLVEIATRSFYFR
jgi:uncharacterized membrane protein YjjP (DUF1212 family)